MPSLRADLARWNARQQAARDAYHEQPHAPKAQPCRGCGRSTEAVEGWCRHCRKDARP